MCGICGLAHPDRRLVGRDVLLQRHDAIRHRGPDSDGFFRSDGVGLAVRRLAVIGLKEQQISRHFGEPCGDASAVPLYQMWLITREHVAVALNGDGGDGDLLVEADRMTMAASLEGRWPFLDHELVDGTARLPDHMKMRGFTGNYLLRKAFAKELPAAARSRRKQGFGLPLASWFRAPLADWSHALLLRSKNLLHQWFQASAIQSLLDKHARARVDHGKRMYAIWARGSA